MLLCCEWTRPAWLAELSIMIHNERVCRLDSWLLDLFHNSTFKREDKLILIGTISFILWNICKVRSKAFFEHETPIVP